MSVDHADARIRAALEVALAQLAEASASQTVRWEALSSATLADVIADLCRLAEDGARVETLQGFEQLLEAQRAELQDRINAANADAQVQVESVRADAQAKADAARTAEIEALTRVQGEIEAVRAEFRSQLEAAQAANAELTEALTEARRDADRARDEAKLAREEGTATDFEPQQIQHQPVRRVARLQIRGDLQVVIGGASSTLVDLSTIGAQVLSPVVVRPNQLVQALLADSVQLRAKVVWATFQLTGSAAGPQYRAGIEFVDADPKEIDELFQRLGLSPA